MKKKIMKVLLATCMSFMLLPAVVLAAEEVVINETNFPDAIFRSYVSDKFDTDANGTLSTSEINSAISVNVSGQGITDLRGVEYLTWKNSILQLEGCCGRLSQLCYTSIPVGRGFYNLQCGICLHGMWGYTEHFMYSY